MLRGPVTITYVETVLTPAHYDYLEDTLHGLNVRHYNYLAPEIKVTHDHWHDPRFDVVNVPFAVMVWDDGFDYDMDGNAYFDDYPGEHLASSHLTRKGAEMAAAYLEDAGIEASRIRIVENYDTHAWEMEYHPMAA